MKGRSRIFGRRQGGAIRYYLRAGDYADVGGRVKEALTLPGKTWAVTDLPVAETLAEARLAELRRKRLRTLNDLPAVEMRLAAAAAEHLKLKAAAGRVGAQSIAADELNLTRACDYFGADTLLEALSPQRIGQWAAHLQTTPVAPRLPEDKKRGKRPPRVMGASNARKSLNSLSNLYRRAQEQGWVGVGVNPVSALMTKPQGKASESRWFEAHEVALLIESARTLSRKRPDLAAGCAYELVATAALTGARPAELLGLTAEDVSFDRNTVLIRGTKTDGAFRSVPLWPQLREVLYPYICPDDRTPRAGLLFRSPKTDGRLKDARTLLDAVATRCGFPPRSVNLYAFRHSFCAAALQLLDRGAPIAKWTVSTWMGHGSQRLIDKTYGHLGEVRCRAEALEFRVEQHAAKLKDRLVALHASPVSVPVSESAV